MAEGLRWVRKTFSLEPEWTVEPKIEAIKQQIQKLRPSQQVELIFLAQGALNKIYDVTIDDEPFIMRVSLQIDAGFKTLSEIAIIEWVRRNTHLPVPAIIAHQETRDNPIGFEWILMSKIPGVPLADKWRSLSISTKEQLVQRLAAFATAAFQH